MFHLLEVTRMQCESQYEWYEEMGLYANRVMHSSQQFLQQWQEMREGTVPGSPRWGRGGILVLFRHGRKSARLSYAPNFSQRILEKPLDVNSFRV